MKTVKVINGINNKLGTVVEEKENLKETEISLENKNELSDRAWTVFQLSLNRANRRIPKLFKDNKSFLNKIYKIYYKAQLKIMFKNQKVVKPFKLNILFP